MNNFTYITDFHGERAKGIGSSDLPILMGLTKNFTGKGPKTPLDLWEVKTGRAERWSGNQKTFFGHELEPIICGAFVGRFLDDYKAGRQVKIDKISGRKQSQIGQDIIGYHETEARMTDYPWALAHADMVINFTSENGLSEEIILEAKSHSFFAAQRKDDVNKGYNRKGSTADDIPLSIWCQVQWQMMCYEIKSCYVAALIDTNDFRTFGPIKSEPRKQEKMLAIARRFWDCIVEDRPPKPETWGDVKKLFPVLTGESIIIGGVEMDKALEMKAKAKKLRKAKKNIDTKLKEIQTAIGLFIQGGDILTDPEGKKIASRSIYDTRSLPSLSNFEKDKDKKWIWSRLKKFVTTSTTNKLNF